MFVLVILVVALLEFLFIPMSLTGIIIFLISIIALVLILEILFPRSQRRFRKLSQKKLQELFGIKKVELKFNYDPEKIDMEKFVLSVENPTFSQGLKLKIPFSYEQNTSAYVDFSYLPHMSKEKAALFGNSTPIIRAELVCDRGSQKPSPLRGPTSVQVHEGLHTERFFLDHPIIACQDCKIQGYIVVLNSKIDYAVYRFPPLLVHIIKRRMEGKLDS